MYRVSPYICNTCYVWIWMDYMNTAAADICARQEGTNVVYVEGAIKGEGSKWPSYTAGQCNTHSKEECICISFIILRIIYIKRVIWNVDKGETKYITNYLGSNNTFFFCWSKLRKVLAYELQWSLSPAGDRNSSQAAKYLTVCNKGRQSGIMCLDSEYFQVKWF